MGVLFKVLLIPQTDDGIFEIAVFVRKSTMQCQVLVHAYCDCAATNVAGSRLVFESLHNYVDHLFLAILV